MDSCSYFSLLTMILYETVLLWFVLYFQSLRIICIPSLWQLCLLSHNLKTGPRKMLQGGKYARVECHSSGNFLSKGCELQPVGYCPSRISILRTLRFLSFPMMLLHCLRGLITSFRFCSTKRLP